MKDQNDVSLGRNDYENNSHGKQITDYATGRRPQAQSDKRPQSRRQRLVYDFSSRKFLVFVYVAVSGSWLLWTQRLPPEEYTQVILWVTALYFGANLWQAGVGKPTSTPFRYRLFSRKFLLLLALLLFFTLATVSQVMPATQYTTLVIWMTGIYFGIDIGELHSFRGLRGVGKMFRDDIDPSPYQPGPGPFGPFGPATDDRVTASEPGLLKSGTTSTSTSTTTAGDVAVSTVGQSAVETPNKL